MCFMDAWMNNSGRARCKAEQESRWLVSSMITSCAVWLSGEEGMTEHPLDSSGLLAVGWPPDTFS